jgi:hypothetical protein
MITNKIGALKARFRHLCARLSRFISGLALLRYGGNKMQKPTAIIRRRMSFQQLQRGFDSLPPDVRQNGQTESLALASGVLRAFMNADWVERHVISDGRKKGFLSIDESDPVHRETSFFRVMDLAEVIYNLQPVPGFDECITRMRDGDIEGTYAELDFGRMLYLNKVPFRFVVPQGTTGFDYDIEVEYPNGIVAAADAKCKIESTDFSENTIGNTLSKARKQLPDDSPGIVFVKVPPRWIADPATVVAMLDVARSFLRGTRRVVSVKYYSSPITFADNMLRHDHAYKEISNPMTDFGNDVDWNIFKKFVLPPEMNGMPPHWQRIIFFPDGKPR